MANFSFDVVSEFDRAELNNVFGQAQRELANRYDFKNTPAALEWLDSDKNGFKLIGNGEWQLEQPPAPSKNALPASELPVSSLSPEPCTDRFADRISAAATKR